LEIIISSSVSSLIKVPAKLPLANPPGLWSMASIVIFRFPYSSEEIA